MARNVIPLNNPILKLADSEAALATGVAYECQITSAVINPQPVYNTIPSTGCAGASESPGITGWQIDVTWLQDWGKTDSLSHYAYDNDTLPKWYSLTLDSIGMPGQAATGQAYISAGSYGGTFGDGSAPTSTAVWKCLDKPIVPAPLPLAESESAA
jgi:hypothetical protein